MMRQIPGFREENTSWMKRVVYRSQNRFVDSIEIEVSDENKNEHEDQPPGERGIDGLC